MATSKKRKLGDAFDGDDDNDVEGIIEQYAAQQETNPQSTAKKPTPRRPRKKRIKPPKTCENLFMKLPGELRNRIYHLVLVDRDCRNNQSRIFLRTTKTYRRALERLDGEPPKPWREPALLRASKDIHKEASSIYYGVNWFTIFLHPGIIEQACAWIKAKHDLSKTPNNQESNAPLSFYLHIALKSWDNLKSLTALAKLFYDITFVGEYNKRKRMHYKQKVAMSFRGKLREAALLGVRAKCRGLTYGELETDFKEWVKSHRTARAPEWDYRRAKDSDDEREDA